jgi:hypothetical protein
MLTKSEVSLRLKDRHWQFSPTPLDILHFAMHAWNTYLLTYSLTHLLSHKCTLVIA